MSITSVNVKKVSKEGSRMRGIASIVIDDALAIHDIRIIEGERGLFVAFPSKTLPNNEHKDIVHPISATSRKVFEEAIIEAFKKEEEE